MTLLHSCCCWRTVRHGSIACGVYTGIYYIVNAAHSLYLLHEEICFFKNSSRSSLIDHDLTSETAAVFSSLIFAFSSCGAICSILLFYGIYKDIKYLLIPWIFNMVFFTIIDIIYIIHGLFIHALQWNPSVAILITIDFFLNTLNLYAILCVTSQYQEYRAGRGKAADVEHLGVSNHQFSITQPTAPSYLSSNHTKPRFDRNTPRQSHTEIEVNNHLQVPRFGKSKKSVKFGDNSECEKSMASPLWEEGKRSPNSGIDTAPLIDTGGTMTHHA